MNEYIIENYEQKDCDEVLKLNKELVEYLSPMDKELFNSILYEAELCKVVRFRGKTIAFFILFREGKCYNSINYRWFLQRYSNFLYIDRIVIHKDFQSKGIGCMMYDFIKRYAENKKIDYLTAEIDIYPKNDKSINFHRKLGFKEVGTQKLLTKDKIVSLQLFKVNF